MSIKIEGLSVSYGSHDVLKNITFAAAKGDCVAVLGPNGVGKSTLFRCILGFLKAKSGQITLGNRTMESLNRRETAACIAYIPQFAEPIFNYTVLDTVLMGVTHHLPMMMGPGAEHTKKAMEILESLGIAHLSGRGTGKISGGERQLALLARALIQDADILLMDEPTANLDYGNRSRVMERIGDLGKQGYTIIFSTHEPNQAFHYANKVIALKGGKILAEGNPTAVLTGEVLSELYGIKVYVGTVAAGSDEYMVSLPFEEGRKHKERVKKI